MKKIFESIQSNHFCVQFGEAPSKKTVIIAFRYRETFIECTYFRKKNIVTPMFADNPWNGDYETISSFHLGLDLIKEFLQLHFSSHYTKEMIQELQKKDELMKDFKHVEQLLFAAAMHVPIRFFLLLQKE